MGGGILCVFDVFVLHLCYEMHGNTLVWRHTKVVLF